MRFEWWLRKRVQLLSISAYVWVRICLLWLFIDTVEVIKSLSKCLSLSSLLQCRQGPSCPCLKLLEGERRCGVYGWECGVHGLPDPCFCTFRVLYWSQRAAGEVCACAGRSELAQPWGSRCSHFRYGPGYLPASRCPGLPLSALACSAGEGFGWWERRELGRRPPAIAKPW